jgi:adenylate kinase family enzyme
MANTISSGLAIQPQLDNGQLLENNLEQMFLSAVVNGDGEKVSEYLTQAAESNFTIRGLLSAQDKAGNTALILAVRGGHTELVKRLLAVSEAFAVEAPTAVNYAGENALQVAQKMRNSEIVTTLSSLYSTQLQQQLYEADTKSSQPQSADWLATRLSPKQRVFAQVLVKEFMDEYRYLGDVAAGRAAPRRDFTQMLLKLLSVGLGTVPAVGALLGTGVGMVAEKLREIAAAGGLAQGMTQGHQFLQQDAVASSLASVSGGANSEVRLRNEIEKAAELAAVYWGDFINMYCADTQSVVPFARVGVLRIFEFLCRQDITRFFANENKKPLPWNAERFIEGLIQGRSGGGVTGFTNHQIQGGEKQLTAEGAYGRSGLVECLANVEEKFHEQPDTKYGEKSASFVQRLKRLKKLFSGKSDDSLMRYGLIALSPDAREKLYEGAQQLDPSKIGESTLHLWQQQSHRVLWATSQQVEAYLTACSEKTTTSPFAQWLWATHKEKVPNAPLDLIPQVIVTGELQNLQMNLGDFSGVIFDGCPVKKCQLGPAVDSRWWGCQFNGVTAQGADLSRAVFDGAVFEGGSLTGARLTQASFKGVILKETDLKNIVDATGIDVTGASGLEGLESGNKLQEAMAEIQQAQKALHEQFSDEISELQKCADQYQQSMIKQSEALAQEKIAQQKQALELAEAMKALQRQHSAQLQQLEQKQAANQESKASISVDSWHVPAALPNSSFFERSELINSVERLMAQGSSSSATRTVLVGMAGVGKTTLAKHIINHPRNQSVFRAWLSAESKATLLDEYRRLAQAMGWCGNETLPEDALVELVRQGLAQLPQGWLLVFDNADTDIEEIAALLPTNGGQALLTSRRSDWDEDNTNIIKVGLLTNDEALALLGKRLGEEISENQQVAAMQLVKALGYLPLAITQAAAYVKKQKKTIAQYLELFEKYSTRLLAKTNSEGKAVATTWQASLDAIAENAEDKQEDGAKPANQYARELLTFCAYLQADDIPEELLQQWLLAQLPEDCAEPIELMLEEVLGNLLDYSLITRSSEAKTISLHRLLQSVLREAHQQEFKEKPEQRQVLLNSCYQLINSIGFDSRKGKALERNAMLMGHAITLAQQLQPWLDQAQLLEDDKRLLATQLAKVYTMAGHHYMQRHLFGKSGDCLQRAQACWQHASLTVATLTADEQANRIRTQRYRARLVIFLYQNGQLDDLNSGDLNLEGACTLLEKAAQSWLELVGSLKGSFEEPWNQKDKGIYDIITLADLADAYLLRNMFAEAKEILLSILADPRVVNEGAVEDAFRFYKTMVGLVKIAIAENNWKEARERIVVLWASLPALRENDFRDVGGYFVIAKFYLNKDNPYIDPSEAIEAYKQALEILNNNKAMTASHNRYHATTQLALLLVATNKRAEAERLLDTYKDSVSEHSELLTKVEAFAQSIPARPSQNPSGFFGGANTPPVASPAQAVIPRLNRARTAL